MADRPQVPTAPPETPLAHQRRYRAARRVFVTLLAAFLLLGLLNVYGVRTSKVAASGGGYQLEVKYAEVSRPGLATPWTVDIRLPSPPPETVTLATTGSYFDLFDENSLDPEPVDSVSDGERIIWTFATDPGSDRLSVSFDARIEPGIQFKRTKATSEILEDGTAVVGVEYSTFVMP